ncbi:MAG: metallophosphoesterase [Candidatus Cloacimonetes bacterium]|nr:metallophosphoesterase [Candidatus Cloacimonadota bacterium]MCF7813879.1 metallophosphoesterase [Candidatus Cloacimonadota bacterium]MCF7868910.1 metallophosphoesterase [Candidatus Cloacimonadota bacterium]MCF7883991.1 metallophosphoesterase [Candidatus Cloacimonadota bacterium]
MKKIIIIFLLFIFIALSSQEIQFGKIDSTKLSDGPYISWQNDDIFVDYIYQGKAYQKTFSKQELEKQNLAIPELNFDQKINFEHKTPKDNFQNIQKFFVVSDIHGQFNRFVAILKNNSIIDNENNWIWENGHLIILGDIFDRGTQVTESLWLIYKLENQAEKAGGKVHVSLGNHELMIFQNDLRYIHEKYIFVTEKLNKSYSELFVENTVLGNWLRSKPVIIKIDNNLFCHAGISPKLAEEFTDFKAINTVVGEQFLNSNFKEDTELDKLIYHSNGPFWYRGYFYSSKRYDLIKESELDAVLAKFQSHKIIVGHSTQDSVLTLWNGKVIAVDSGIKYGDKGEGLLWQNNKFYRAFSNGEKKVLDFY